MRLLLVDDDRAQIKKIKNNLVPRFVVETASCNEDAIIKASCEFYDLIIISIGVSDCQGLELIRQIKADQIEAPILAIAHDCTSVNAAHILNCGADALIQKPFCWPELLARVSAVLRQRLSSKQNQVTAGRFALHLNSHHIMFDSQILHLQRKRKMILECLIVNHPTIVTRMKLYSQVWERDCVNNNNVDVQICQLRKSLVKQIGLNPIKTMHGFGYRLEA